MTDAPTPWPDVDTTPGDAAATPVDGAPDLQPLGPDSLVWRLGFPRASLLLAGRALLLQVAHPTIGAGVRDFSNFRVDPWGRLDRTVTSLLTQLFGGPASLVEADRLREMHRSINGTGFHGERYQALEPAAYAWVHLANFDSVLAFHDRMGTPMVGDDRQQFYAEWCQVGRLLGIRDRYLPPDLPALADHVDAMVATTLGDNETVRVLLETLTLRAVPPPARLFPRPLWQALTPVGRHLLHDGTVGTLPPALRTKLGLAWTDADERRLDRIGGIVRAVGPRIPDRLGHYSPAARARREAVQAHA
jgi:uncharacterized protein (DUF2236 family)